MNNQKGGNNRTITQMSISTAAVMRGIMAQRKTTAAQLVRETRFTTTTLNKTLQGKRAIDIEDLYTFCEYFKIPIHTVVAEAEKLTAAAADGAI